MTINFVYEKVLVRKNQTSPEPSSFQDSSTILRRNGCHWYRYQSPLKRECSCKCIIYMMSILLTNIKLRIEVDLLRDISTIMKLILGSSLPLIFSSSSVNHLKSLQVERHTFIRNCQNFYFFWIHY